MRTLEEVREKWLSEKPLYEEFGGKISEELRALLSEARIHTRITARVKEDGSLMKKVLLRKKDYSEIRDKVGVRVVVDFLSDVSKVDSLITKSFGDRIVKREDKLDSCDESTFGYQSIHYDILGNSDLENPLFCELQLRTLCQDSWSNLAHILSYKPGVELPKELRREVYALSALFEIADRQFQRIAETRKELSVRSPSRILSVLDGFFYSKIGAWYDSTISHRFLAGIEELYSLGEAEGAEDISVRIVECLERYIENQGSEICRVAADRPDVLFFSQPEIVVILERLENSRMALKNYWESRFPLRELERIASAWGTSID